MQPFILLGSSIIIIGSLISAVAFINKQHEIPQMFLPKNFTKPTNFCPELWLRTCKRMLTKCKSYLGQPRKGILDLKLFQLLLVLRRKRTIKASKWKENQVESRVS